jgi:hypothetical protein
MKLGTVQKEGRTCVSCGKGFFANNSTQERCKKACRRREAPQPVKFCGVDGEGSGRDPSRYVLLGCGQEQIARPEGLAWKECFEFLYAQFEAHPKGTAFVGFYLGYDFTQILKSMPQERVWRLITSEGIASRRHKVPGRQPHAVEYDGWQFDILGTKRLKLRPKRCACMVASCKCPKAPWMFVCDTGGFWQTSFLNVIHPGNWAQPICTADEYRDVETGKGLRDAAELGPEMRCYNRLENELLKRAMGELRDGFEAIGVHLSPGQWFGPGQAAQEWMKTRLPKRKEWEDVIPGWYIKAAKESYYGGWFEIFVHGYIGRDVFEYDINSAYPATIRELPCLLHGRYSRGKGRPEGFADSNYTLVRGQALSSGVGQGVFQGCGVQGSKKGKGRKSPIYIGSMLHRNSEGSISRPLATEGWFWLSELHAAQSAGLVRSVEIYEWVNYEPCGCKAPLAEMDDLYARRLAVGKDTVLGKACKLIYNSCYGKFAQSVGSPRFGNPVYASRITSKCRERLVEAIGSHPRGLAAVAMVATDAVFFLEEHGGLDVSTELGAFSRVVRRGLTVFKPGVYWDEKTREAIRRGVAPKFKARGVSARDFAGELAGIDSTFRGWREGDGEGEWEWEWPRAEFRSSFSMVTALQALRRGNWGSAGVKVGHEGADGKWVGAGLKQSSDPSSKRSGRYWDGEWGVWRSEPQESVWDDGRDGWDCVSKPYVKTFGFEDPFGEESMEELGVNDDGNVQDLLRWVLKE